MNSKSLTEVHKRVSRRYLGKVGIHGIGVRRKSNALCIHFSSTASPELSRLLKKIENEVAPYRVLTIEEDPPTM